MLDRFLRIGIWGAFILTATIMVVNSAYMLISPTAWFGLPKWLRLQGVLTLDRYGHRWGAMQVRILGAIIIVTIIWIGTRLLAPVVHKWIVAG
jgi:hypothetical protein